MHSDFGSHDEPHGALHQRYLHHVGIDDGTGRSIIPSPSPPKSPTVRGISTAPASFHPSPLTSYDEPHGHPEPFEELLDWIEDNRWELRDARENLHGVRYRLQEQRRALRKTRDRAAVQSATAYDLFKRYLLQLDVSPPREIQIAMEDADTWRDKLGKQEVEYEQAEEKYNMNEWNYTETEKSFVDNVFAHAPQNSAPGDDQGFTHLAFSATEVPETYLWRETTSSAPSVVSDMNLEETNGFVTRDWTRELSAPPHRSPIPAATIERSDPVIVPPISRLDENDPAESRSSWLATRQYIEAWLFRILQGSQFQQALLRNMLSNDDVKTSGWWELAQQHWGSDGMGTIIFHTGDTTASRSASSRPSSTMTQDDRLVDDGAADSGIGASFADPLTSQDQFVETLDFRPPLVIEDSDLVETSSLRGSSIPPLSRPLSASSLPKIVSQQAPDAEILSLSTHQTNIVWRQSEGADSGRPDRLQDTSLLETPTGPMEGEHATRNNPLGSADATVDTPLSLADIRPPEPAYHVTLPAKDSICSDALESDHSVYRSRSVTSNPNLGMSTAPSSKESSSCIVQ
jgi:hypothetical protein